MILPGATLGVLGGGQLGRMFTLQARTMGYRVALARLGDLAEAITTEFENVPAEALERLSAWVRVRPPVAAVAIAQDRIAEKSFLERHGFGTARFRPVR